MVRKEFEGPLHVNEDILYLIFNTLSGEELENSLEWDNIDGYMIYKVLGFRTNSGLIPAFSKAGYSLCLSIGINAYGNHMYNSE